MNPTFAVVIPAYQSAGFIEEALDSITAQTVQVQEIVVVDDGSTDGIADVVTTWSSRTRVRLTLIRQENGGAGSARKVGIHATRSEFILFLDADDRLMPNALELLHGALDAAPTALMAYGAMRTFFDQGASLETAIRKAVIATGPAMIASASLIRRGAFEQIGIFDDSNLSSLDWFARVLERGPEYRTAISSVVCERRIHAANTSTTEKNLMGTYARIVKASLDRRRATGQK